MVTSRVDSHLIPDLPVETWRVEIRNSGLGAAIIKQSKYKLVLATNRKSEIHGPHQLMIQELAKTGLLQDEDYWLEQITPGFGLTSKESCFAFEIKTSHLDKIKAFEMLLVFSDQLGGKYSREIIYISK